MNRGGKPALRDDEPADRIATAGRGHFGIVIWFDQSSKFVVAARRVWRVRTASQQQIAQSKAIGAQAELRWERVARRGG